MLRAARRLIPDHDLRPAGLIALAGLVAVHAGLSPALSGTGLNALLTARMLPLGITATCALVSIWLVDRRPANWKSVSVAIGVWSGHLAGISALSVAAGTASGAMLPTMLTSGCGLLITGLGLATVAIEVRFARLLSQEARRFRVLADATLDGLMLERHGQVVDANRAMGGLMECDAGALIGGPLSDLLPGIEMRLSQRGHPVEHALHLRDGRSVPVEVMWHNGPDPGGRVVVVRDLTREKVAEREIERLAHVDPLTGLLNRHVFEQKMRQMLIDSAEAAVKLAVLYIDLDRFEVMNEAVGHQAVEQILVQMGHRLSELTNETGLAARLGRDAFVVIQPLNSPFSDPTMVTGRVLADIGQPFQIDEQPITMTASIGVAVYPDDSTDADGLLECAILALCQAKRDGHGRWCRFRPDMDQVLQKKRSLGHDLRVALKENQFSLHYQPFVDTATLEVVGYEALLRWEHPQRGRVSPADFIPLSEETGLIVPIGNWVLGAACAEAAAWDNDAIISVNLSPAQFIQSGLVAQVAEVLHRTGLPPRRLELEITEGTLMDDTQNALRILTSLKGLGVKIAMDDFGTGYSSLSYLRRFPFDKIKIDRSFISDADSDSDAETIVQAIIAMGRSLRLHVTAEGVEKREQLAMLRALGCDFVQGFLLGRPCSADQLDVRYVEAPRPVAHALGPWATGAARIRLA
jgi:diguanylate cyclase